MLLCPYRSYNCVCTTIIIMLVLFFHRTESDAHLIVNDSTSRFSISSTNMAEANDSSSDTQSICKGPISEHQNAKMYLEANRVPQMFQSLLSCLMLEQPDNCVSFMSKKLEEIREMDLDQVDWECFIKHLHPRENAIRKELVKDYDTKVEQVQVKNEMQPFANMKANDQYKPTVFQLTEPQD